MVGKILIVDDVATNRIVLKVKLANARYQPVMAASGQEALDAIARDTPDLILLDLDLGDMNGIDICKKLKQNPKYSRIPVVIVTANTDRQARLDALHAGADDVLPKPVDDQILLARMRSLLRAYEQDEELRLRDATLMELGFAEGPANFAQPARIGLIAPNPEIGVNWRAALRRQMPHDRIDLLGQHDALNVATQANESGCGYDAFVIAPDLSMPGEGLRLMSELRSRSRSRHAAICIAVPPGRRDTIAVALDLGADDLLPDTFSAPELAQEAGLRLKRNLARKRRLDQQRATLAEGLRLATIDPLTGLFNRRYALPHLNRIASESRQANRDFAILILDMDRFKSINDTFGHAAGDSVLVEVAKRLSQELRASDIIARFGGEEFLVALPNTSLEQAGQIAGRLCRVIEQQPIALPDNHNSLRATVSIGMALGGTSDPDRSVDTLIEMADRALMYSKAHGRNQVRILRAPNAA
ncbi:hypothetical protein BFP70_10995 [Thioclava sp. SK-1]|nr:hypothetical protein BFP70_10995 [Thioclava sp. SK-1]